MDSWFTQHLQKWYKLNKRNLPWRNESDPYKIWLSEVILQQTQVKQGLSYYLKFTKKYPQVQKLAKAPEDEVMKLWQGLGYYSRARNMHAAAKAILKEHGGEFPENFEEMRKLKGVGLYTASAIASFAFHQPHAVVDGNVYRVLSRVFGVTDAIDSTAGKQNFQKLADELLDKKNPGTHNQAVMEFGSQFCKPLNPDCGNCTLSDKCYAYRNNKVQQLPVKSKKTKVSSRYFNYFLLADRNKNILVNKRQGNDIWKGLYDFNLVETNGALETHELMKLKESKALTGKNFSLLHVSKPYKHVLTHRILHARFYVVKIKSEHKKNQGFAGVKSLTKFAFPRLIEKFLNDCNLNELL